MDSNDKKYKDIFPILEEITWAAPRHSREEVLEFFHELADKVQPEKFEIIEFIAQGDKVVVAGRNQGQINPNIA